MSSSQKRKRKDLTLAAEDAHHSKRHCTEKPKGRGARPRAGDASRLQTNAVPASSRASDKSRQSESSKLTQSTLQEQRSSRTDGLWASVPQDIIFNIIEQTKDP